MLKKSLFFLTIFIIPFAFSGFVSAESKMINIVGSKNRGSSVTKTVNDYTYTTNSYNEVAKKKKNTEVSKKEKSTVVLEGIVNPITKRYIPTKTKISTYNKKDYKNSNRILTSSVSSYTFDDFLKNNPSKIANSKINTKNTTPTRGSTATNRVPARNNISPPSQRLATNVANSVNSLYNKALGKDSANKRVAFSEISKYGWNVVNAMNVSFCESGYTRRALNHSSIERSLGLFQVNLRAHSRSIPGKNLAEKSEWLYTPANNVNFAYRLWSTEGWRPWLNCSRKLNIL